MIVNHEDARRRLRVFERDYGSALVRLASHAALPVVLNPDFVHLLRVNYFLDPPVTLSYAAEAELLLSPLCNEVDQGLYVIDPELRDVLLQHLIEECGSDRLHDVAHLLWEYGQRGTPWLDRPGLSEAQQLTALNFIDPTGAQDWLARAEESVDPATAVDERWFVAMRQDLEDRAAAVPRLEEHAEPTLDTLPARATLIRYIAHDGTPCVGSGLLIDERRVLTADHVANGSNYLVESARGTHNVAAVLRSNKPGVDLAVLNLTEPVVGLRQLKYAQINRSQVDRVSGCTAVGFPEWKKDGDQQRSAEVDGWIPTAEGLYFTDTGARAGWLTLVSDPVPGAPSISPETSSEMPTGPWAGMSGAAVVAGDLVIGVVSSHNPAVGRTSFRVTPVTAIDQLPDTSRQQFWHVLGVADPIQLPVLPQDAWLGLPSVPASEKIEYLRSIIQNAEIPSPRISSLESLALVGRGDPAIARWLRDIGSSDVDAAVRKAVIRALADSWYDDLGTSGWLRDRSATDPDPEVRIAAIQALAVGWHDDPSILAWLGSKASEDGDADVRSVALEALSRWQRPASSQVPEPLTVKTPTTPADERLKFPARRLSLIDIENLAGDPVPSVSQVLEVRNLYSQKFEFGATDQVVVATSHPGLVNAAVGWPHASYRVRSGPDGADLELLDVLRNENVAARFTRVVIGSGDHLFAEEAARLAAEGVWVTVVSRRGALSHQLKLAASEVIYLDDPDQPGGVTRSPVMLFYLVCDVSASMREDMPALNDGIARLRQTVASQPTLDDIVRISIIAFSGEARVVKPLGRVSVGQTPELTVGNITNYGNAFRTLAEEISNDVDMLWRGGYQVLRPCAFFLTGGEPSDGDWHQVFAETITRNPGGGINVGEHPLLIPLGFREAREETLRRLAYPPGQAKWYQAGEKTEDPVSKLFYFIIETITASARSAALGESIIVQPVQR